MSSHHDWVEERIAYHDKHKPFAPENGKPLKFKIGDKVVYRNGDDCLFEYVITDYYQPPITTSLYAAGHRYFINSDSYWFPIKEHNLTLAESNHT
jgi:hypothetical protein